MPEWLALQNQFETAPKTRTKTNKKTKTAACSSARRHCFARENDKKKTNGRHHRQTGIHSTSTYSHNFKCILSYSLTFTCHLCRIVCPSDASRFYQRRFFFVYRSSSSFDQQWVLQVRGCGKHWRRNSKWKNWRRLTLTLTSRVGEITISHFIPILYPKMNVYFWYCFDSFLASNV